MTSLVNSVMFSPAAASGVQTFTFDAGSTPNRVLHVLTPSGVASHSVTFNGVAVGFIQSAANAQLWELIAPPSGSNTLSIQFTNTSTYLFAWVVDGVNQSVPWYIGEDVVGSATSPGLMTPWVATTDMYTLTAKVTPSGNTLVPHDGTLSVFGTRIFGTNKVSVAGAQGLGVIFDGRWDVNGSPTTASWVIYYRPVGIVTAGWYSLTDNFDTEGGNNDKFGGANNVKPVSTTTPQMTRVRANNGICAAGMDASGNLYTWGSDNSTGMLGDGVARLTNVSPILVPTKVVGVSGVVDIAVGLRSVFFVKSDGTLWYFGRDPTSSVLVSHTTATQLTGFSNIVRIQDNSDGGVFALDSAGLLWFVGSNTEAQAGNGTHTGWITTPTNVLSNVVDFACSEFHSVACKTDGTVWCWGGNDNGCTGQGTTAGFTDTPTQVPISTNVCVTAIPDGFVWDPPAFVTATVEAGMRFRIKSTNVGSFVCTGARIWNPTTGQITAQLTLWGTPGLSTVLAQQTFSLGTGMNTLTFSSPISLVIGSTHTISYTLQAGTDDYQSFTGDTRPSNQWVDNYVDYTYNFGFGEPDSENFAFLNAIDPIVCYSSGGPANVVKVETQDTPSTHILTSTNQVWHWGSNVDGDAGDNIGFGSLSSSRSPHQITMPAGKIWATLPRACRADGEMYIIDTLGELYTWGANYQGGQARNGFQNTFTPQQLFPNLFNAVLDIGISGGVGWYILSGSLLKKGQRPRVMING